LASPSSGQPVEEVFGCTILEGSYHGLYYNGTHDILQEPVIALTVLAMSRANAPAPSPG